MERQISEELFVKQLLALLQETFVKVDGIYLDRATSLVESLAGLSAAEASRPTTEGGTTVAGQVGHIRFYIAVLRDYMDGKWQQGLDWKQSWLTQAVTQPEWADLQRQLKQDYDGLVQKVNGIQDWNDERRLGGALAVIAHTAYHLGSIRQMLKLVKNQNA